MNVTSASTEEVNAAAAAASAAFYAFGRSAPALRARLLRSIADGIERLGNVLIECAARETALAEPRLVGELARS
jgi:acyl-CoA reductase-like NAD-dependent aldehyde dehydrogenase